MKRSNDLDSNGIRLSPLTIAWQTVLKPAIQIVEMNPGLAARASVFTATAVKYQASGARRHGRIRGVNLHMPATRIGVDKTISEADPADYNGLLLPGGFINPDLLRQSAEARQFVREFANSDKPIATLCHGLWVLASAGLLNGRTLTSWPGIRDDLVNSGATWLDRDVVKDGNLVTSRGPQDMTTFIPAILDHFADTAPEPRAVVAGQVSDPPLNSPVGWAVAALRWAPKPSIPGALAGLIAGARLSPKSPLPKVFS